MELMEEGDIEALEKKWFDLGGTCRSDDDQPQVDCQDSQFLCFTQTQTQVAPLQ